MSNEMAGEVQEIMIMALDKYASTNNYEVSYDFFFFNIWRK